MLVMKILKYDNSSGLVKLCLAVGFSTRRETSARPEKRWIRVWMSDEISFHATNNPHFNRCSNRTT